MHIILTKKRISLIRKIRKQYPNNEVGFVLTFDNILLHWIGKKNQVKLYDSNFGIRIHTHNKLNHDRYECPSYPDLIGTLSPKNINSDNLVFDSFGFWIFRANKNLAKSYEFLKHYKITNEVGNKNIFVNKLINEIHNNTSKFYTSKINLSEFLDNLNNLITINNREYGFIVKYIPYYGCRDVSLVYKPKKYKRISEELRDFNLS